MANDPKCDSDYANLAGYSQGSSFIPVKAPIITSTKVDLFQIPQKSGYQSLKAAYPSYPTTYSYVQRPCCAGLLPVRPTPMHLRTPIPMHLRTPIPTHKS